MGRVITHVPSDEPSTVVPASSGPVTTRKEALRLIDRRQSIEKEIEVYMGVLSTHGADFQTPLIDSEGYPRADIDVAAIRTARSRLNRLRNDLRYITDDIALSLEHVLARKDTPEPEPSTSTAMEVDKSEDQPFALVDGVAPSSPAAEAGLKRTDLIIRFDTLHAGNHDRLRAMAEVLARNEGTSVSVTILRSNDETLNSDPTLLHLTLSPRKWSGRGLLGCHVVPI